MNIRRGLIRVWAVSSFPLALYVAYWILENVHSQSARVLLVAGSGALVAVGLWWAVLFAGFWIVRGFKGE